MPGPFSFQSGHPRRARTPAAGREERAGIIFAMDPLHILFFEPNNRGHCASYVDILAAYVKEHHPGLRTTFALTGELCGKLSEETRAVLEQPDGDQGLMALGGCRERLLRDFGSPHEIAGRLLKQPMRSAALRLLNLAPAGVAHWTLGPANIAYFLTLEALLEQTAADHACSFSLNRMDTGLRYLRDRTEVPISGIAIHPTLHYATLRSSPQDGSELAEAGFRDRQFRRILKNPRTANVYVFDPYFAQGAADTYEGGDRVVYLPDMAPNAPRLRDHRPPHSRTVFLLPGALAWRKGLHAVLDAIARLDHTTISSTSFVFAGEIKRSVRGRFLRRVRQLQARVPDSEILVKDGFRSEMELGRLIDHADVILLPYLRWGFASGLLYWAARAHRPIITQDYGLLSHLTHEFGLGITVNTLDPRAVAAALVHVTRVIRESPRELADPAGQDRFCEGHAAEDFARTLINGILDHHHATV